MFPTTILAAAFTGCEPTESAAAKEREIVALRVEPEETTVEVSAGAPAEIDFVAIGTFGNGDEDVIDLVSWDLSNVSVGEIDSRGHFLSVDGNGGNTTVSASHLDLVANATLNLVYTESLPDDDVDPAVVAAFAAATPTLDVALAFDYPFDGALVPRNLAGLRFMWTDGAQSSTSNVARIEFQSDLTHTSAYTTANTWEVPTAVWETITATNSHGTVEATVTLGNWDGATLSDVRVSPPIEITVNRLDARGSFLYWSVYDGRIMRVKAGETEANPFYPIDTSEGCYGCHAISEKRQWMVATKEGLEGQYRVLDAADPDNLVLLYDLNGDKRATYRTLSPDGNWMCTTNRGALQLYDLPTNALVDTPTLDGAIYESPDWSPGGDQLVAVRVNDRNGFVNDLDYLGGEIVLIPWDGATLGTPQVLVAEIDGLTQYYPAFSPDGRYVVFNRSTGDTNANPDAELWLVDALGGDPIRLDTANGEGDLQNSLARWAPLPDDDILWLAYSSKRPYPVDSSGASQIWVTAIDPELMDAGVDPSLPPFWIPGQRPDSDNQIPVWWSQ